MRIGSTRVIFIAFPRLSSLRRMTRPDFASKMRAAEFEPDERRVHLGNVGLMRPDLISFRDRSIAGPTITACRAPSRISCRETSVRSHAPLRNTRREHHDTSFAGSDRRHHRMVAIAAKVDVQALFFSDQPKLAAHENPSNKLSGLKDDYSIGSPRRRLFTRPRPITDGRRLAIPQRSEPLTDPPRAVIAVAAQHRHPCPSERPLARDVVSFLLPRQPSHREGHMPVKIGRREVIAALGSAATWPLTARAQQPAMPVVGLLDAGSAAGRADVVVAFRKGLAEAGFVEGQNVALEFRWADGNYERLPILAADLVSRRVSVIVTPGTSAAAIAAREATPAIPIVFGVGTDPVKLGLVANLNRPGGNVTGVSFLLAEVAAKRMQLLRELVPAAHRIAVLVNPTDLSNESTAPDVQAAAGGLEIVIVEAATGREIDMAFARLAREKTDALFAAASVLFTTRRAQLAILSARYLLPAAYSRRSFVEVGGLMSYGTDVDDAVRQVGLYTGRILKGTKPSDLPVMQSTKFEFAINLNTANALGLTVPPTLLASADEVIE